jgi:hypothetical protein
MLASQCIKTTLGDTWRDNLARGNSNIRQSRGEYRKVLLKHYNKAFINYAIVTRGKVSAYNSYKLKERAKPTSDSVYYWSTQSIKVIEANETKRKYLE